MGMAGEGETERPGAPGRLEEEDGGERKRRAQGYKYIIISYTARIFVKYAKRFFFFLVNLSLSLALAHTLSLSFSLSLVRRVGIIDLYFFFFPLFFVLLSFHLLNVRVEPIKGRPGGPLTANPGRAFFFLVY